MSFKVSARTVFQLGAELISSDGVAFYELVKNAFDAISQRVDIDIVIRIDHEAIDRHRAAILFERESQKSRTANAERLSAIKAEIIAELDMTAPRVDSYIERVNECGDWSSLVAILEGANYIEITDTGHGMSSDDLEEIYLRIGTNNRSVERKKQRDDLQNGAEPDRPILGEKGIGRLSVMRLGWNVRVKTSREGEVHWNILKVDWRRFTEDPSKLIQDISVKAEIGKKKEDRKEHGTRIRVTALASPWSMAKIREVADLDFSRLTDPFSPKLRYPISIRYNGEAIPIPTFDRILLQHAHATSKASFSVNGETAELSGTVNYKYREREKTFSVDLVHLLSIAECRSIAPFRSLGPFTVTFFWFNRQLLTKQMESIGEFKRVKKLQEAWAGGLMVYRDGFRVNPYGGPDDDWLDLDKKAFASGGYKVNRRQIIGKVDISSLENASLSDQTNREGIRDCEEKRVLRVLLQYVLQGEFKKFLDQVDDEVKAVEPVDFGEIRDRVGREQKLARRSLKALVRNYPAINKDTRLVTAIKDSLSRIDGLMDDAQEVADSYEKGRGELVHLAGIGLMVEVLAHELNRATEHALETLGGCDRASLDQSLASTFDTLESQLKTLRKRLRILDPLGTASRQRKEAFDLVSEIEDIIGTHKAQFERHGIQARIEVKPTQKSHWQVKMVRGMFVQIMGNLLGNSVYWLKQQRIMERVDLDRKVVPAKITVCIDIDQKSISVTDTGPGVPASRKEEIFQPFVTTKPPGQGKGLGLFISREIAKYHNASLAMSDEVTSKTGRLNTFVLRLAPE